MHNKVIGACSTLSVVGFGAWFIFEPGFEPTICFIAGLGGLVSFFHRHKKVKSRRFSSDDITYLREFIRRESEFFTYIYSEYSEIAYCLHDSALENLAHFRDHWFTDKLRSFNPEIRKIQDDLRECLVNIRGLYDLNMYDGVANYIRYVKRTYGYEKLEEQKDKAKELIDNLLIHHQKLVEIAEEKI